MTAMTNRALASLRQKGVVHPFGAVENGSGVAIYQTGGLPDAESKRSLMNAMRLASNDMPGDRSALCLEGWTISTRTPTSKAILAQLQADGRSIRDHPEAVEALFVSIESDEGHSTRIIPLTRTAAGVALGPVGDDFQPAPNTSEGEMTGFHVTPDMRSDARFRGYMDMVRFMLANQHEGMLAN